MPDDLYFTIEWRKRRKKIDIDDHLSMDEKHEAAEKSLFIVESLVYCLTESAINSELGVDERFAFFDNVRETIYKFLSSAIDESGEIDERRKELEKKVSKLLKK